MPSASVDDDWAALLRNFLARQRKGEMPDKRSLSFRQERQSRVSGGALLKFLRFFTSKENFARFPELKEAREQRKALIFLTDEPGTVAGHDIFRMFRPDAIWLRFAEWQAWRTLPEAADSELEAHIEYWSGWKQASEEASEFAADDREVWVHAEGYDLGPDCRTSVQHLWLWTGKGLKLITPQWRRKQENWFAHFPQ